MPVLGPVLHVIGSGTCKYSRENAAETTSQAKRSNKTNTRLLERLELVAYA